jgi:histidyl-tRNA synthetase
MMKEQKFNLQPLTGMVEFSPSQQLIFEHWKRVIEDTYSLCGFTMVETPILERSEILLAKAGGETEKQIYRFNKGDTDLALRFDLTVPLARFVAARQNELVFPFRRQAMGKVYRGEKPQKGRYREFYQADADIIGRGELDFKYDAEVIGLAVETIKKLRLGEFQVQISNRKLVMGLLASMKVMDEEAVMHLLDKAEKIGEKKLKEELKLLRLDTFEARKVKEFIQIEGKFEDFYQGLARLNIENEIFDQGLRELGEVAEALKNLGVEENNYTFNTGIIRGLDYYTGTVFETKVLGVKKLGSVCSGGRYDNLVKKFAKEKMVGVGMSIGLTRLFALALELGLVKEQSKTVSEVVILPFTTKVGAVLAAAGQLRQAGMATEVYLQETNLKKKLKYANDLGVKWAVIIGDNELEEKKMTLKNMKTGEQQVLSLAQLIDAISEENNDE